MKLYTIAILVLAFVLGLYGIGKFIDVCQKEQLQTIDRMVTPQGE